jgi:hypothetical protein
MKKRLGQVGQGNLLLPEEIRRDHPEIVRTPFRIAPELKKALTLQLLDEGYGIKGKSRWVAEAIRAMIEDPRYTATNIYKAQILEFAYFRRVSTADSVNLPGPVRVQAWHAMLDTMKYGATLTPPEYAEVTISDVLHIAILSRLSARTVHADR